MKLSQLKTRWLLMESMKKKECNKVLDKYTIYIVNGKYIRDNHHADYIGGGHPFIYDFIPKDEIWLEDLTPTSERKKILAHEMTELLLMRDRGWSYLRTHDIANDVEGSLRDGVPPSEVFEKYAKTYFPKDKELADLLTSSYNSFKCGE